MLTETQKERLRTMTVELLLDLRAQYLRTPGCNVLKHWDQLTTRMRTCAAMTANPDEWATLMLRKLQVPSPSRRSSDSLMSLSHAVRELGAASEWLDLIEREHGFLIASARQISEQRRDAAADAADDNTITNARED